MPKINNKVGPQDQVIRDTAYGMYFLLVLLTALICGQIATQVYASHVEHAPVLGANYKHIYPPWGIVIWWNWWYDQSPAYFELAAKWSLLGLALGAGLLMFYSSYRRNSSKPHTYLHGSARWAGRKDIEMAGLLPGKAKKSESGTGVYVGAWVDKKGKMNYLRHSGPEHVLCYAPTRSGKGVGLVIPTLLSWEKSAVITDLKGELWALTAGWRKQYAGNKVLLFEPANPNGSIKWNPLDEIRINTQYEVGDAQNLATLIVDPDGKGLADHWQKTSRALLVGMILYVLYKAQREGTQASIQKLDYELADPTRDIKELWMEMILNDYNNGETHEQIATAGKDMADRPEEEAGSVLSTAKSYLDLFRDPVVAENTSTSEFKIKDLMHTDDPVSLYIVTQPNDKGRLKTLVRIMVNMVVRLLADDMTFENGRPKANYKHRLLMMLDEFPSLGKLEIMQESLAFVAGYGIKCYLICQDINQLKSRETGYGADESITSNCHIQNAYPPNRVETAEHLSKMVGQTTVIKKQVTLSGKRIVPFSNGFQKVHQETQRALLTADECMRMPGPKKSPAGDIIESGDMLIFSAGFPTIYGKQPLYFKDPIFQARAAIEAPAQSDILRERPDA